MVCPECRGNTLPHLSCKGKILGNTWCDCQCREGAVVMKEPDPPTMEEATTNGEQNG